MGDSLRTIMSHFSGITLSRNFQREKINLELFNVSNLLVEGMYGIVEPVLLRMMNPECPSKSFNSAKVNS